MKSCFLHLSLDQVVNESALVCEHRTVLQCILTSSLKSSYSVRCKHGGEKATRHSCHFYKENKQK